MNDPLDYSEYVNVKITKVYFMGEPSHWELDITDNADRDLGSGTSPDFNGIYDMAYSIIRGGDKYSDWEVNSWTEFDANDKR